MSFLSASEDKRMTKPEDRIADDIASITVTIGGKKRRFDIDEPKLPDWIAKKAMESDGYPYAKKLEPETYEAALEALQIELVKLQAWLQAEGGRVMVLFEGRDAAGKGGAILALRQHMNHRTARNVALPKPTETERGQWYFQRYVAHFPAAGEFVTFDRSWYNRAGVEPVMGFCTPEQHAKFLAETPEFERLVVGDGIHFFKFWLGIGQEMQLKRFHNRRHSPMKSWKFSPIDAAGLSLWDDYTAKRDLMMKKTHSAHAPWTVVKANDKRRARLAVIRRILLSLPYDGRDLDAIGKEDEAITGEGQAFLRKPPARAG